MADIQDISPSTSELYQFFEDGEEANAATLNRPLKKLIEEINDKVKPISMASKTNAGLVKMWIEGNILHISTDPSNNPS